MSAVITVLSAGLAAVQDLGRHGYEHVGIAVNGAADQTAARVANTLVGNPSAAPLLEIVGSDFAFAASAPLLLAVTGAPAAVTIDGQPRRMWDPVTLEPGQRIDVCHIGHGLRTYTGIAGTLDTPYVMNSCAPDSLLGIGRHLAVGDIIQVETTYEGLDHPHFRHPLFALRAPVPAYGTHWRVPVTPGPDLEDYDDGLQRLSEVTYRVGARSDHVGLRLEGAAPRRLVNHEILSRGVPVGAIEAPPGAGLLALQRGRHVTAGYPVLAVATHAGRRALGQAAPGHTIRFEPVTLEQAIAAHQRETDEIAELRRRVHTAFDSLGLPRDSASERTTA